MERACPGPDFVDLVMLNELSGHDEKTVCDTTTATAISVLDRVANSVCSSEINVDKFTPWERDRLLVKLYQRTYGNRISSTVTCKSCNEKFDLDFVLTELAIHCQPGAMPELILQHDTSTYELVKSGTRFRLPTGKDECAIAHLDTEQAKLALIEACLCGSEFNSLTDSELAEIQDAMKLLSPVIDLDLDAGCAECGQSQQVRFSVQDYLLSSLLKDKENLFMEIHMLAGFYNWSLNEILDLKRSERKKLAVMIDAA